MRAECVQAVQMAAQAIGKTLTAADLRNIEGQIYQARKQLARSDLNAYRNMTPEQQLAKAGELVSENALHNAIKKRQRAEIAIKKDAEIEAVINKMMDGGLTRGQALDRYVTAINDYKGGVQDLESYIKGVSHSYLGKIPSFHELIRESSFAGIQTSMKNMTDFLSESYGIDSGNALAKKAWKEVDTQRVEMIKHFNRLGGDIAQLANYRNPQATDQYKVLRAGGKNGEAYVADYMQWVDRSEYVNPDGTMMNDAQMAQFLKESFVTVATDGLSKMPGERGGAGMIANRNRAHRQIHYKSPEAYLAAMDKYGAGNMFDQVRSSFESMATDIALAEKLGPNAILNFDKMYSRAKADDVNYDKWNITHNAFRLLSGQRKTTNPALAHWMGQARAAIVASRLGSMLLSQMADSATAVAVTRSLNIPTSELLRWVGETKGSEARDMARLHGLGIESAMSTIARFADDSAGYGFFGSAATVVPTIQGAHLWTRSWRQGFGLMLEAKMGDLSAKHSWADLPQGDKARLEAMGITDKDFAIWKLAIPTEYKGSKVLGADAIDGIPATEILKVIPERIQAVIDTGADLVTKLTERTGKEMQWVANREQKLADYKAKMQKAMDDYEQLREKRVEDLSDRSLERAGEMMLRMEKAEADMEFAKKSIEAMNEKRSDKFMADVERGVEWYGRRRSEIGERMGAKRHSAKLESYRNEAAIEKIGKELSAKFNELFGREGTEDGFKVIGDVIKAAKEYDAYSKKMEDRIAKNTKKDGTTKSGKEGTIERAERLSEQARIEYEAIKQRAETAIETLRQKSEGKLQEIEALQKLVDQNRQRAENEADIASYIETEKNRDKVQGLLDTLEFRFNQDGERMMSEGERIGYRQAMMESQIRQMDRKVAETKRIAGKEVFAKATDFEKRIDKRVAELQEFSSGIEQRATERQKIIDEWQLTIGDKITKEAEIARQDAAMRYTAFIVEQSHQAVLQPGARSQATLGGAADKGEIMSEVGKLIFQFKSFPMAILRQSFIERANFQEGVTNPLVFRAKLLALTSIMGGMSLVLNDLVSGKDPRQIWDSEDPSVAAKFGYQSLMKGGGLGFFGDVIDSFKNTAENPYAAAGILGPVPGYVVGDLSPMVYHGIAALATQDDKEVQKFTKEAYESIKGITPGQNLWFIKGFLHNIILDDLQEMANPGYKRRATQRAMENYGQEYWLGMDQDPRAPQFGNMVQQ